MLTSLDLLVIVVMALAALSLVATVLMFLVKNRKVRQVCLWITAALGIYVAYAGLRINWGMFPVQMVIALLTGLAAIGAFVLERVSKGSGKLFLVARIIGAAALIFGMINAFCV